jgi:hypothetical protein
VRPDTYAGDALIEFLKNDEPFMLEAAGEDAGSTLDPNAPVAPSASPTDDPSVPVLDGVRGTTAAKYTCTITNDY